MFKHVGFNSHVQHFQNLHHVQTLQKCLSFPNCQHVQPWNEWNDECSKAGLWAQYRNRDMAQIHASMDHWKTLAIDFYFDPLVNRFVSCTGLPRICHGGMPWVTVHPPVTAVRMSEELLQWSTWKVGEGQRHCWGAIEVVFLGSERHCWDGSSREAWLVDAAWLALVFLSQEKLLSLRDHWFCALSGGAVAITSSPWRCPHLIPSSTSPKETTHHLVPWFHADNYSSQRELYLTQNLRQASCSITPYYEDWN